METWKTLAREQVLSFGKWLTVERHRVALPDGQVIEDWPWIITPDYINVVVVTTEGRFLLFRQTKYAVEGVSLAVVGGYIEPGEEALAAAQRELMEETGYEASRWQSLGSYRVDANRGAGTGYLFLAREARRVRAPNADDLEEQELLVVDRPALEQALQAGQFKVLAWAAIVALALRALEQP